MANSDRATGGSYTLGLLALFFASGAAALIYEVLWLKELSRLFGATAPAAATTLASFFLGLAAGGWFWGRRTAQMASPLRAYGLLELGVGATALLYFLLFAIYRSIFGPLYESIGSLPVLFLVVKFVLAVVILLPPAFFLGGTLPAMGEHLVRLRGGLGFEASRLYSVNTAGGATGAFLAGFVLPQALGFHGSYVLAVGLNVLVAAGAVALARQTIVPRTVSKTKPGRDTRKAEPDMPLSPRIILVVAALSGFLTLGLEVLWTRMFAQVLQNSVYTFSAILTVFLICLALGAAIANRVSRRRVAPHKALFWLLMVAGLAVGATPVVFEGLHPGLAPLGADLGWGRYIATVFLHIGLVLALPIALIGAVFPYLMKASETLGLGPGRIIGQLAATNTLAAIVGSLSAGFLLLQLVGLWWAIGLAAVLYIVLAGVVAMSRDWAGRAVGFGVSVGIVAVLAAVLISGRPGVHLDDAQGERLVDLREGSHGTVAVVRRGDDLRLKVNNGYLLGTSLSTPNLRLQAQLPLCLHPDPRRVFILGMGTGISAGGALDFPDVEQIRVCELNGDVVDAACRYFEPYLNGLCADDRVEIVVEDGRTFLAATDDQYDVVIADIFLTYKAGVGALYTREHFKTVRERLAPGGMFVQWVTMFDLSPEEFGIIARTMLEVFPQVTLWRRGFSPSFPVFALVGNREPGPLDGDGFASRLRDLMTRGRIPDGLWLANIPLAAYAGNLTEAGSLFESRPVSTDDRLPLEYLTPRTERDARGAGRAVVLAWKPLAEFCSRLLVASPPADDPYLRGLDSAVVRQVFAGGAFYEYETARRAGLPDAAAAALAEYRAALGLPSASK